MEIRPVTSLKDTYPSWKEPFDGPSKELLAISKRLKAALEGLSNWIQTHPLMPKFGPNGLIAAARKIGELANVFRKAHSELVAYHLQLPEPPDAPISYEIQQILEKCFLSEIDNETQCQLPGYGFTSWGSLILSTTDVFWSPELLQFIFNQVSPTSWKKARNFLGEAHTKLI